VLVKTNLERRRIIISGMDGNGFYEVQLTWSQAALLATMLNEASHAIEPQLNFGKTYTPVCER